MPKLVLSDREVGLIKGLISHEGLNDQQVLSIFSYLDRNINHREIGSIRTDAKPKYAAVAAASKAEVDELLYHYSKIAALADRLGFCDMDGVSARVYKAVEIMKTAILIYNNNMIETRSETFIVLAVIAWTYLLHAKFGRQGMQPIYFNADGTPVLIDGKSKFWELGYCITRAEADLSTGERNNLQYIIAVRNEVEHRSCEDINADVQSKLQATALNFLRYAKDKFGSKFDFSHDLAFTIQLQALGLRLIQSQKAMAVASAMPDRKLAASLS